MATSSVGSKKPNDPKEQKYVVRFNQKKISTTVTKIGSHADEWVKEIQLKHEEMREKHLMVGLDVERYSTQRPGVAQQVATLQLCVDQQCLIFQLLNMDSLPLSLVSFLSNKHVIFVGVAIEDDVRRLKAEYGLEVSNWLDLRSLAIEKLQSEQYEEYGLKRLARVVLGVEMKKPLNIILSDWRAKKLRQKQVEYACIDAAASFYIGLNLTNRDG